MKTLIKKFIREEDGASAVEYAVLVGAIAALVIAASWTLFGKVQTEFENAAKKIGTSG